MEELDKILILNLARRPERREACLRELQKLKLSQDIWSRIEFIEAVDGLEIDEAFMDAHCYGLWPHWKLENHQFSFYRRDLKKGELGCALSHMKAWRQVINENLNEVLILEDDAIFAGDFVRRLTEALDWLRMSQAHGGNWELLYVGRQPVLSDREVLTNFLVKPGYSYCAHAYVLTHSACSKLLSVEYEKDMIAVDELLPAMFHQHPRKDVRMRFRSFQPLNAFAITPSIASQANVKDSDTEQSVNYHECIELRSVLQAAGKSPSRITEANSLARDSSPWALRMNGRRQGLTVWSTDVDSGNAGRILAREGVIVLEEICSPPACEKLFAGLNFEKTRPTTMVDQPEFREDVPLSFGEFTSEIFQTALPWVLDILGDTLGDDPEIVELSCMVSYPGAKRQAPHPDVLHDANVAEMYSIFIPLIDQRFSMGPLMTWPGTHLEIPEEIAMADVVPVSSPAGSLVIMNSRLLHCGGANLSTDPRPVMYFTLMGDGDRPKGSTFSLVSDFTGMRVSKILEMA